MTRAFRRPAPTIPGAQDAAAERDAALAKVLRRQSARARQRSGAAAELLVANRLRALGLQCIEKQATPMAKVRGEWTHCRQTTADYKALAPGGRAVLIEIKKRARLLQWSDLRAHQVAALDAHVAAGGLALLAYVSDIGIHILNWRPIGFGPGTSLTPGQARGLDLKAIP